MPVAASQVFEFLERQKVGTVERHEIASAAFGMLRRSLRQMALKLCDSDDQEALRVSNRLRVLLCEWLTVPIPFDISMLSSVEDLLGGVEALHQRWGSDLGELYETALRAAEDLPSLENPVREKLRRVILELQSQERTFKIYCHRRARPHFESLFASGEHYEFSESAFLHSLRDYCETRPFDVLIKVGPLRIRGWGSAPDALLTAPRFGTLFQIVWSGCSDDPDFGYDPVSPPTVAPTTAEAGPVAATSTHRGPMEWNTRVTRSGEDPGTVLGYVSEDDELRVFKGKHQSCDKHPATLVQVDEEYGILYPPHSKVLSFDTNQAADERTSLRIPGETLFEGMFLIMPRVDDVDLGGVRAEHGHYSQLWRTRLEQEWRANASDLIARLHSTGLTLVHLNAAIRHWCKPPGTVIHAPQQMKHFEILLRVLGIGGTGNDTPSQIRPTLLWQLAWNEVRRSRGEAIQTGVQEQEIIEAQQLVILRKLMPQILDKALVDTSFHVAIPVGNDMKGGFLFHKVWGVEENFRAPETELRVDQELNQIDQWRD